MTTILLLDDESIVRQSLVDFFGDQGWVTVEAESAEDASLKLESQLVHAVVVDIRLPGMDGSEFIRGVCTTYPQTAFLICTGSPDFEVPVDLCGLPNVSTWICRKPIQDLDELKLQVQKTMSATMEVREA